MTWCSLFADRATRPRNGGVNGDLLIKIQEEKHPELIRDGNDLIYNLMLDFPMAALGGSAEVPTVEAVRVSGIAAGTQPGKVPQTPRQGTAGHERRR